jgi:hypothetical protein
MKRLRDHELHDQAWRRAPKSWLRAALETE